MKEAIAICWFRQDLRLSDHPALTQAAGAGKVLPIYILDDETAGDYALGAASRWWLHHSLNSLNKSLSGQLHFYRGTPKTVLQELSTRYEIKAVYWNRCYEPWRVERDAALKYFLKQEQIDVESFNGSLLWEPWEIKKSDHKPYRVFTPFYRKGCLGAAAPREPLPVPSRLELVHDAIALKLDDLYLKPHISWDQQMEPYWKMGEQAAQEQLSQFLKEGIANYKEGRNFPAKNNVSRLSPYLHFGEVSPHQVWHAVRSIGANENIDHFCSELGWREFSYHLLYQFPELPRKNLQSKFDHFPWHDDQRALKAWQKGLTGYPIIDAGMRELWQTGYVHNRVRMIVASFLVKNLLLDWRLGERWFWDCLVDADLANNSASWQWVAGSGADAAPYFRIFNSISQGEKFDPTGEYTKRFVPELAKLPSRYLFKPWEAPESVLEQAGVILGKTYPFPIVDLQRSRAAALEAFFSLKGMETQQRLAPK